MLSSTRNVKSIIKMRWFVLIISAIGVLDLIKSPKLRDFNWIKIWTKILIYYYNNNFVSFFVALFSPVLFFFVLLIFYTYTIWRNLLEAGLNVFLGFYFCFVCTFQRCIHLLGSFCCQNGHVVNLILHESLEMSWETWWSKTKIKEFRKKSYRKNCGKIIHTKLRKTLQYSWPLFFLTFKLFPSKQSRSYHLWRKRIVIVWRPP